jgi:gas vesicle protein
MLAGIIESALVNSSAEALTNVFLWALIACFGAAILLKRGNHAHSFTQYAPTLLTTLGILGTFAGIISGLLGFDVDNIDESIGSLLAGLKTAFTTSLAGMTLSILYKLVIATGWISPKITEGVDEDEIGVVELYSVMREQAEGIDSLRTAIGGDGEASLVGQMKLMRSDLGDQHKTTLKTLEPIAPTLALIKETSSQQAEAFIQFQDRLWIKLQDFADMLSKSATEQVINALKEVIADFNKNLIEQFGENFKQLNAAVLALVTWQENYKQQLLKMSEQYELGVQAISQTEAAISHISEESKAIPASMQELKAVMEVNQHQLQELESHLAAFVDIRDRAVEAVPEIRAQIDQTVSGMQQVTASLAEGMSKTTETLVAGLTSASDLVTQEVAGSVKQMSEGIAQGTDSLKTAFTETGADFVKHGEEAASTLSRGISEATDSLVTGMNTAAESTAKGMTEASTRMSGEVSQAADSLVTGMNTATESAAKGMTEASTKMSGDVSQAADSLVTGMNTATESAAKGITEASTKMSEAVIDSSGTLQKSITTGSEELVENSQRVNASLQGTSDAIAENSVKTKQMFDDAVTETNAVLRTMVADLKDDSHELTESYKTASQSLVTETDAMRSSFEQGLTAMRQQLGAELKQLAEQQAQENQRLLKGMSQHADEALKDTGEAVQKQVKMLDDALNHELNRVMNEMGRALTTISGKFTTDYQQLVNEMNKVTRMQGVS